MMKSKKFDSGALYERLFNFGTDCQHLVRGLPENQFNIEYGKQLIRSSGSVGANYIEALEASSEKDFVYRLRVVRKETRESIHWLRLIKKANKNNVDIVNKCNDLVKEGVEIKQILSSSILTLEKKTTGESKLETGNSPH